MTSFLDVIQPLTDQLKAMSDLAVEGGNTYTLGTTKFRNHIQDVGQLSGSILFLGQGANAFKDAVMRNSYLSNVALARLNHFQLACDNAWKTMEILSEPYDSESSYLYGVPLVDERKSIGPYETYEYQYFLNANLHGYTAGDGGDPRIAVVRTLREGTLSGLSSQLNTLLDPKSGPSQLESNVSSAASGILSDFDTYQTERGTYLDNALQSKAISSSDHQRYKNLVDSSYTAARQVVASIVTNMQAGYGDWDMEFIAAANNFVAQVSDADTGKPVDPGHYDPLNLYSQIDNEFHDPRTRNLLYAMLNSPYGAKVVQYLLTIGDCKKYSPCGDKLIVWQDGNIPEGAGAFNQNNVIILNAQSFDPSDPNPDDQGSLTYTAGLLAHEAVETYYGRAYHIPADTLPMDYFADYVRQVVSHQMAGQPVGSYPDYQQWYNGPGGSFYRSRNESNDPGGYWNEIIRSGAQNALNGIDPNFAGNPMGLDPSLLQNDPNWNISKFWDPATNSFRSPGYGPANW